MMQAQCVKENEACPPVHLEIHEKTPYGRSLHNPNNPIDPAPFLSYLTQGGADDMTKEEAFTYVFIAIATRWPNNQEQDAWLNSGYK